MKKLYFLILFCFFLSGCHKKKLTVCDSSKSYIYSDATEARVYTLKLTCRDTVYLTDYLPIQKTFFAINKEKFKSKIDSLVDQTDFAWQKKSYLEFSSHNRHAFKIFIQHQNKLDSIFVYGENAPPNIYKISKIFNEMLKSLKFFPYTKNIDYGKHIVKFPPPPPPPSEKQTFNETIF